MNTPEIILPVATPRHHTDVPNDHPVEPTLTAVPSGEVMVDTPDRYDFQLIRGLAAAVTIAGMIAPSSAEAAIMSTPHKQPTSHMRVIKPLHKQKCTPHNQVIFTLRSSGTITADKPARFHLTAKRCDDTSLKGRKKIKLVGRAMQGQKKSWKTETYAPGTVRRKNFSLSFSDSEKTKKGALNKTSRKVAVKALSANGKQIGSNQWKLKYSPAKPVPCKPNPAYERGVQDDDQFIWQRDVSREQAFQLATRFYGASVLRINMIHGVVMEHGYQPYIDTVNSAIAHGYKVQVTIMQTPVYLPGLPNQALNYKNLDPTVTRKFAKEIASTLGNRVMRYSIGNEPDHPLFSETPTFEKYAPMFRAGRAGVLAANHGAEVLAGELASPNKSWLKNLAGLKTDGIALHPYNNTINQLPEAMEATGEKKLYLTEYGNFANNPNQIADNKKADKLARCSGAEQLVYFQIFNKPHPQSGWNTGVVRIHQSS